MNTTNYKNENLLVKYLNNEIETKNEKNILLKLDDDFIKTCNSKVLLAKGEMTMIIGPKNCGKSKVSSFLIRQLLIPKADNGVIVENNENTIILVFDSEMGESRLAKWNIENIFHDFDREFLESLKSKYFIKSLKKNKPAERFNEIKKIVNSISNEYPDKHLVIVLDIATCLTTDINASSNGGLVDSFYAIHGNCSYIVVSHNNIKATDSKSEFSTGSIGTAFEKISSIKLSVEASFNSNSLKTSHKVTFKYSKFDYELNSENDYFFINTEKIDNENILITGITDSNGPISENKLSGNTKITPDEIYSLIEDRLNSLENNSEERLRKNLINYLINEKLIKIGKSRTHEYISDFIQKGKLIDDNSFLKLSEK
jgi:energy-coupling factor transporter ATP-binding protein EcfA2